MRIVAIDGPAGAGKSTVARNLAERLSVPYLDTGAMYRAVTYAALRDGLDPNDETAVVSLLATTRIETNPGATLVDGVDVSTEIRGQRINSAVSHVAAMSGVRVILRQLQRDWVFARGGGVVEGRDIGTVVFPDATVKVFLTASPEVRARRRVAESGGDVDEIARWIAKRDALDSSRTDSPLRAGADYVVVDTSTMTIDTVVDDLYRRVIAAEEHRV